jgi:hypothetical protein
MTDVEAANQADLRAAAAQAQPIHGWMGLAKEAITDSGCHCSGLEITDTEWKKSRHSWRGVFWRRLCQ